MPLRTGITTRPYDRRAEWAREHPGLRSWQVFGPFVSRTQAEAWESLQHDSQRSGVGAEGDLAATRWWGYRFHY